MNDKQHYNELMTQIKIIKDRIRGVVRGHTNGIYLHGRPGTSKTFTVDSTLKKLGVDYVPSTGHLAPIGLFNLLAENRDGIIVLDDVTAIFSQPIALQLLLAALGNPPDGSRTRQVKYKTANKEQVVAFTGGIIGISNLPLAGHHHEVLAALNDRIYVIGFEPPDEQIYALIQHLAKKGLPGVSPAKAQMVARFLRAECKRRDIRPSVRLFVDKAIPDYRLFAAGETETHWRDLIRSNLEQQTVELEHPTKSLRRADQIEAERRIAQDVCRTFETRAERVEAWTARTGKSEPAFYRRLADLKNSGHL